MDDYSGPYLLSSKGSTRATAYGFSNKSVTIDGRTHVVWLDAVAEVCGRTYDHAAGTWSETYGLFEGCDNHTSPALTVDKDGHIHIAFGPHGIGGGWNNGRFKWAVSERPNDISAWREPVSFGYNATYACLAQTPQDLDVIVYRGGERPPSVMFQRQQPLGGWSTAREIFRQDVEPQYTHYGARCTCDSHDTLYAGCHFYNVGFDQPPVTGDRSKMRSYGVAVLKSPDLGQTWTDLRGERVRVPAVYGERIAAGPVGADIRLAGLAVDREGRACALTLSAGVDDGDVLLSRWDGEGWQTVNLASQLPDGRVAVDGTMTVGAAGRFHLAVTAPRKDAVDPAVGPWGHPSCEVFHVVCDAALRPLACRQISTPDETAANWLPNVSLPGPYQPAERPVILYTHGVAGVGCKPPDRTEVYCVMPA